MMINDIIVSYLSNNKRLVIPNFGAFLKKEDNTITFVELLKKDDEVFTSLVSKGMGVSRDSAVTIIDDYIITIKERVKSSGTFAVGSIGSFIVGAHGAYSLIANNSLQIEPPIELKSKIVDIAVNTNLASDSTVENKQDSPQTVQPPYEPKTKSPIKRGSIKQNEMPNRYKLQRKGTKKHMDIVMIIAIVSALLALAVLIYGAMVNNDLPSFNL